ncbi:carbohydrate-binding protein [Enterococcus villorum]|uniref:Uncharacterized protein n=2 Tax=Enterococcus villorum TaxID=112904 RepID=A0A511J0Y9_9ENTE|nr:carbohydrate-binding protein [Enterococcus villorum]EOH89547.1 hypothetical protein UAO_01485 [Enterococcus villorum ATCC 700913]EOW76025.1 hypothetical protein I591_01325 [Enterococcus villorum ATCC 700913]GEL91691.1 hypothetical protein EVI01_10280 [Enterococcus villorum]
MNNKRNIKKILAGAALCSLMIAPLILNMEDAFATEQTSVKKADFGVGQGIQWADQVVAPFVDMTAYVSGESLGNNGALNLAAVAKSTGQKFFNLGFMQSKGLKDGKIDWAWGGFPTLNENESDGWQYEGIKKSIRELREVGGDVAISFGGLNAGAFWETTQNTTILADAYKEIIEGYGLTRVDFDVEAGAMDYAHNLANAKAVKQVQDQTGVSVTLTLPVMDTGLISTGLSVLQAYLEAGVDLTTVNIMTMCYGSVVPDYAQGSLDAVDNTKNQLQDYYKRYANTTLTDAQAYAKLGTTPSIGFESSAHPYFTTDMFNKVVQHAKSRKLGMVSYWSMNRDAMVDSGQGQVKNQYEFLTVAQQFTDDSEGPVENLAKPSIPVNLNASAITQDSITLNWANNDSKEKVTHYEIYRNNTQIATTTTNTFKDQKLTANTTYSYQIKAVNATGASDLSQAISVKTSNESESTPGNTWTVGTLYEAGDIVTYKGLQYRCIQGHRAMSHWAPDLAPTLWIRVL